MSKVYKSEAIVLRKMKYSESSIIVDLFTEERGIRSFIVSGVRSSKGKQKAAYFQYNQILNIVAHDNNDKLSRLKEFRLGYSYKELMTDVIKSSLGVFLLEVNKNVVKDQTPSPELYHFIKHWLIELDELPVEYLANVPSIYILELCQYLGIFPMNNQDSEALYFNKKEGLFNESFEEESCNLEVSQLLSQFMNSSHKDALEFKVQKSLRDELLDELIVYLKIQLPYNMHFKSLDILRTIF